MKTKWCLGVLLCLTLALAILPMFSDAARAEGENYLTFRGTGDFTIKITAAPTGTMQYNNTDPADETGWKNFTNGNTYYSANNVLYLRGVCTKLNGGYFKITPNTAGNTVACGGDIRALMDYTDMEHCSFTEDNCFDSLFYNCTCLTSGPDLPLTTLRTGCYKFMFYGCTSLTDAPALPATTLADSCYMAMFYGCTSLTDAPALPATTLADSCYYQMFYNCTSLTAAPALPATTLADSCYLEMFCWCTSLTDAPDLPATTLATNCYKGMFQTCQSLTVAPTLPATTLAEGCYRSMFAACRRLTAAPALPATTLADSCYLSMFENCTSLIEPPALPATSLAAHCYQRMFEECSSLATVPALPATELADSCYSQMFSKCTSIKVSETQTGEYTKAYRIPESGTGTDASDSLYNMFFNTGGTFTGTPTINTTYYLSAPQASVTIGGTTTNYMSFSDAVTAWNSAASGATLKLLSDVTTTSTISISGTKTLDLNGYGLTMTGSGRVISIGRSGNLTLNDSNPSAAHKYTIDAPKSNGAGVATVNDALTGTAGADYLTFTGGYITGGRLTGYERGAGVYIEGGHLTINGGTIIGNSGELHGGGVQADYGSITMTGGAIIGNKGRYGGAISITNNGSSATISGGEIKYNYSTFNGGGVHADGAGVCTLTISGGTIINNYTDGGIDTHNVCRGGGVVFSDTTFNLSGGVIIEGNLNYGTSDNIAVSNDQKINITGTFTNSASIGITMATPGVFTSSSNTALNDLSKFTSDNPSYAVGRNADGQLFLGVFHTLAYDANGADSGDVPAESTAYAGGETVTVPGNTNNLEKDGYYFNGWNTAADGSGDSYAADDSITISADTTLYAVWTPKSENPVTYADQTVTKVFSASEQTETLAEASDAEGAVTYSLVSQKDASQNNVAYFTLDGTTLTIAANAPAGIYTVVARATAAGNEAYLSGSADSTVTVNIQATVTYDGNDATSGSVPVDSSVYTVGDTATVLGNTGNLEKTGFAFGGWNTAADGSGTTYAADDPFTITANTTLYALWETTITWKMDDGAEIDTTQAAYGSVPTHEDAVKDDDEHYLYIFSGWNDGTTTYAPDADLPAVTGSATYTAVFTPKLLARQALEDAVATANEQINSTAYGTYELVSRQALESKVSEANTLLAQNSEDEDALYAKVAEIEAAVAGLITSRCTYQVSVCESSWNNGKVYRTHQTATSYTMTGWDFMIAVGHTSTHWWIYRVKNSGSGIMRLTGSANWWKDRNNVKVYLNGVGEGWAQIEEAFAPNGEHNKRMSGGTKWIGAKIERECTIDPETPVTSYTGDYDGLPHTIGAVNVIAPLEVATVRYKDENDAYTLTEAPTFTDAGTYTVYYQVTAPTDSIGAWIPFTGSATVTINKIDPTANAPENVTARSGQTLADVTLTNPAGNTEGTWTWVDDTANVGDGGVRTFLATFTPDDDVNYNTVENVELTVTVVGPRFAFNSLVLGGVPTLRYYVQLPEGFAGTDASMTFSLPRRSDRTVALSEDRYDTTANAYYFDCPVYVYQLADNITATFAWTEDGVENSVTDSVYSVQAYLNDIISAPEGTYSDEAVALATATKNFGHNVQPYLARLNGWTVGVEYAEITGNRVDVADAQTGVSGSGYSVNTNPTQVPGLSNVKSAQYYLNLADSITLYFKIQLKSTPSGAITAEVDGNARGVTSLGNNTYRVAVSGIAANNLNKQWQVKFFMGDTVVFDIRASVLTYVKTVLNKSSALDDELQAMASMYYYYDAAKEYESAQSN